MSEPGLSNGAPEAAPEVSPEARRRHTWHLISISASGFGVLTLLALFDEQRAGTLSARHLGHQVAIHAIAMTVVALGLIALRQTGVRWLQPGPETSLDRKQRRAAARALRPGGVVAPEHRANTVALAHYLRRRRRWAPWFLAGAGLINSYVYLTDVTDVPAERWFYGVCAVTGLAMAGYYLFALRKASAIVQSSGEPGR
jgi:hypothetical protein